MKKRVNPRLQKLLGRYSALAVPLSGAFLHADAQVVYKDIDPDVVLGVGQNYALDLNNDGNIDFKFKVASYGTGWYVAGLLPYPPYTDNLNAFAGYTMTFGGDPSIYPFPSMFNAGDVIDAARPWLAFEDMLWTYNGQPEYFYAGMVSNFYGYVYGQWANAVDKYLAIRFSPDGTNVHYAWIRCDVNGDGTQLTIKDLAFEATPGQPIVAGAVTGVSQIGEQPFGIVNYDALVQVFSRNPAQTDATVSVVNAVGQTVLQQPLTSAVTRIDLRSFSKGMYVVRVQDAQSSLSQKVMVR
ncbi:MAG: T9SS type A sorting domain-containing protein [Chitinophagales bacterium]|nr:T9SS type A sorting domain-containing protein [Chitinophagales bacterium]